MRQDATAPLWARAAGRTFDFVTASIVLSDGILLMRGANETAWLGFAACCWLAASAVARPSPSRRARERGNSVDGVRVVGSRRG